MEKKMETATRFRFQGLGDLVIGLVMGLTRITGLEGLLTY